MLKPIVFTHSVGTIEFDMFRFTTPLADSTDATAMPFLLLAGVATVVTRITGGTRGRTGGTGRDQAGKAADVQQVLKACHHASTAGSKKALELWLALWLALWLELWLELWHHQHHHYPYLVWQGVHRGFA